MSQAVSRLTLAVLPGVLLGWLGAASLAGCGDQRPPDAAPPAASQVASSAVSTAASAPVASASAALAIAPAGQADRLPFPDVPAVVRDGVRYAQAEDGHAVGADQVGGVLVASSVSDGQRLWTLVVYPNRADAAYGQEADAQWVFFKSMAFDPDGRLRIVNEANQAFLVDVTRRTVAPAR